MHPLDGIRVLEFGSWVAGPYVGTILGDFGADVIKVESPEGGDALRSGGNSTRGVNLWWWSISRNKRSVCLDVRSPDARPLTEALIRSADVFVENLRPGALDAYGLDDSTLLAINPRLIVARISAFGQDGPYRNRAAFAPTAEAFGGLTYLTGEPDAVPMRLGLSVIDYSAGLLATTGVLLALRTRDQLSGTGQVVDLALYESLVPMWQPTLAESQLMGIEDSRFGNQHPSYALTDLFATKDRRHVQIAAIGDKPFIRLANAIDRPELAADPRFATDALRFENRHSLHQEVEAWTLTLPSGEIESRLTAARVVAARVNRISELASDEHVAHRGNLVDVSDPRLGTMKSTGVVPKLSATPGSLRSAPPRLGEHTRQVLSELGFEDALLDELLSRRVTAELV